MPLKTLVKVGSLTNLSDARYCAGMGAGMLGFHVIPGKQCYVRSEKFQEIRGWITGPLIVAELHGLENPDTVEQILKDYRPDYLEVGERELAMLDQPPLPLIVRITGNENALKASAGIAYLLTPDTGVSDGVVPFLVEVASVDDAHRAMTMPNVAGIALYGTAELSPGLKTYDSLAPILEALEE